jgi:hypothetical protein
LVEATIKTSVCPLRRIIGRLWANGHILNDYLGEDFVAWNLHLWERIAHGETFLGGFRETSESDSETAYDRVPQAHGLQIAIGPLVEKLAQVDSCPPLHLSHGKQRTVLARV